MQQNVDQGELRALHGKAEENESRLVPWGWQIWNSLHHKHCFTSPLCIMLVNPEVNY